MTYSFLSDEEPTDEQLEQLMKEVGEEACRKKAKADEALKKRLREEIEAALENGK
jgi:arsenate reductase-like glutaredoxin family protein